MNNLKKCSFFMLIMGVFILLQGTDVTFKDPLNARIVHIEGNGNFFIDHDLHSIRKYSPKGKLLREMGRNGEGPGDIKRLGFFKMNPQEKILYVTEALNGNKWISRFSPEGKYLGEWKSEIDWNQWSGAHFLHFDEKNFAYVELVKMSGRPHKDFIIIGLNSAVHKMTPNGKKLHQLLSFKRDLFADKRGKGNVTIPFQESTSWNIHKERLYVINSNKNLIKIMDLEGRCLNSIKLPITPKKLTTEDINFWVRFMRSDPAVIKGEKEGFLDLKFWKENLPFPESKPVLGGDLIFDEAGFLYTSTAGTYDPKERPLWFKVNIATRKVVQKFRLRGDLLQVQNGFYYHKYLDEEENLVIAKTSESEIKK